LVTEERILLVRLSHLGDVVHALPLYFALRERFPAARIAWAVEPAFAGILAGLPGLDAIVPFARREGPAAWPRLVAALGKFAPTRVIDAQGNIKSAAVSLCAPGARRSGLHKRDWRERLGARVLHDAAAPLQLEEPHAIDRMLHLARHVCGADFAPRMDPGLNANERELGERALQRAFGVEPGADDVIVVLSCARDVRSWPIRRSGELARALAKSGRRVLLLSGPEEAQAGAQLAQELAQVEGIQSWIGQRGLRELAGAFTAAARAGVRYVGVDSGPLHLAAACGVSVVALEGPQSHLRTGPWPVPERDGAQPRHRVVRSDEPLACAPCFSRRCQHAEGPVCMSRLSTQGVLLALENPRV
jgi:heptosyltransferase-1